MRRIVTWALSTITVLVLLFSYHTSTSSSAATVQAVAPKAGSGTDAGSGGAGSGNGSGNGSNGGGSGSSAASTYTGSAIPTRFGDVQVQITVSNKKITAVTPLQYPNRDRRDVQINTYALPILGQEAVSAQSADIDMVSGATITSAAYIRSLQSAIDQAHL